MDSENTGSTEGDGGQFARALKARVCELVAACTACGRCVEACPMIGAAKLDAGPSTAVAAGILDILATGRGPDRAIAWATACTGSGACIAACEEGLNPRFMLAMARAALRRADSNAGQVREAGVVAFRRLSRGVRLLSRLQTTPEQLARLGQSAAESEADDVPYVFYIGCNVLRMPHIPLICADVLDALGIRYRIVGGPANCCGVLQFRAGDLETSGRIAFNTARRSGLDRDAEMICWCPSCGKQFGEVNAPAYARATGRRPFEVTMFAVFLERHIEDLRRLMIRPVAKRVGLHEHPGLAGVGAAVRRLLEAIPGLEFVDLGQPGLGSMCSDFGAVPEVKRKAQQRLLEEARRAGVTTLAGIYHACHREFCGHQHDWPFEVVNFMELIGESMGIAHPDTFKRIRLAGDVNAVIDGASDLIARHRLDPAEVRDEVLSYILGT